MWATNRLGSGEPSLLYISTDTVQKKSMNATSHNAQTGPEDSSKGSYSILIMICFFLYISTVLVLWQICVLIISTNVFQSNDDFLLFPMCASADEVLREWGNMRTERNGGSAVSVIGYAEDEFSATAWMVAVTMVSLYMILLKA